MSWRDPVELGRAPVSQTRGRWSVSLLELDAELGRFLPAERWDAAREDLQVRVVGLRAGPWEAGALSGADGSHLGLLVLDGLLGRELHSPELGSLELLGPGDLLRPWDDVPDGGLGAVVQWSVLADTRLVLLDRGVARRIGAYPEVFSALIERQAARSRRLAVSQAISQLTRVDRRLLILLWHLAERWGKVTPEGVVVPLALSHRMLGQLVGARRPTVSTALGELARAGELERGPGGSWILTGNPVGTPDDETFRAVLPRRPVLERAG